MERQPDKVIQASCIVTDFKVMLECKFLNLRSCSAPNRCKKKKVLNFSANDAVSQLYEGVSSCFKESG